MSPMNTVNTVVGLLYTAVLDLVRYSATAVLPVVQLQLLARSTYQLVLQLQMHYSSCTYYM